MEHSEGRALPGPAEQAILEEARQIVDDFCFKHQCGAVVPALLTAICCISVEHGAETFLRASFQEAGRVIDVLVDGRRQLSS